MATFINDIQAALDRHLNLLVYSLDYGSVSNASVLNDDWGSIIIEPTSGVNYGALTELVTPPIAWPNINYEPTTRDTYLRPRFLPVATEQASLGGSGKDVTNAIYQIDVVQPAGSGRTTLFDTIANHFKRGTVLTYNSVKIRIRTVEIGTAQIEDAWYFVPVSISIQTFTEART